MGAPTLCLPLWTGFRVPHGTMTSRRRSVRILFLHNLRSESLRKHTTVVQDGVDTHRVAAVIATDLAVYDAGPARPTGGAGAVAFLLARKSHWHSLPGRSALTSCVFDPVRGSFMQHAYGECSL